MSSSPNSTNFAIAERILRDNLGHSFYRSVLAITGALDAKDAEIQLLHEQLEAANSQLRNFPMTHDESQDQA